jgi:uncharacterized membrane protein
MSAVSPFLPADLDWPQAVAIALIFLLWAFYAPILQVIGRGSLNTQLHAVRMRWLEMHQAMERQHRVFDAMMLGHITDSVSYFGSATLLVLAGLVGALANVNSVYRVTRELAFLAPASIQLFTLNFAVITLILTLSFFAFTYALRKMSYTFALLGGLQAASSSSPESRVMVEQVATVLTEAVRSINNGIRGFYYAIAALFLFVGPLICIAATLLITALLYYRQIFSPTAKAIGRYVEALKKAKG